MANKLFAVHATKTFPCNGKLKAGLGEIKKSLSGLKAELFPDCRSTLHFSLGELVRPVKAVAAWEDCPYAIVLPLSEILPFVINLNCYDTFIMGDYCLGSSATLVLPTSSLPSCPPLTPYEIFPYDLEKSSLREAVDELIATKGGWKVHMQPIDREDRFSEAFIWGENVNNKAFFAPLLKKRPHISVGCRFDPFDGQAYRLGQLELKIYALAMSYLPLESSPSLKMPSRGTHESEKELKKTRKVLLKKSRKLLEYVASLPFPKGQMEDFYKKHDRFLSWINIIDADLRIRELYNKTLIQAPAELWNEINEARNSPEDLELLLDKHFTQEEEQDTTSPLERS